MVTDTSGNQDEIEVGELDVFGVSDIAGARKAREVVHGDGRVVGGARVVVEDVENLRVVLKEKFFDIAELGLEVFLLIDRSSNFTELDVLFKHLFESWFMIFLSIFLEH